jgi:kynurenine formamidase
MKDCSHHELAAPFRELGAKLSNWGRWGDDDRIGTLNFITPGHLVAAAALIRTGKLFDLGIPVNSKGIQIGLGGRINPVHLMSVTSLDMRGREDGLFVADDFIFMPLQSVTQWDGLGHVGYDGLLYNNIPSDTVTTMNGSEVLSIDQIAAKGIAGRGVLLDIAALRGVDIMPAGDAITIADLEEAERRQGVQVGSGDILLVRTGWLRHFLIHNSAATYWNGNPGLHYSCTQWLYDREVAVVASDNWTVEVLQPDAPDLSLPLHSIAIRDMGMTLGEIFDLDALAKDCTDDGVWEFFFTAPPLKVTGGVGAAITPLAIK